MAYKVTNQRVLSRGVPPDSFLDQLVAWGKTVPDVIFAPNSAHDVYTSVFTTLGPWKDLRHRRAVMLAPSRTRTQRSAKQ